MYHINKPEVKPTKRNKLDVHLRVGFFKKIQDSILISEKIRKRILRFFTNQINPISLGSWCFKGTKESTLKMDSLVPWMHHDPSDLDKEAQNPFLDSFRFRNPILDFLRNAP